MTYKIGDFLIHKLTGEVFKIVDISSDLRVYFIQGENNTVYRLSSYDLIEDYKFISNRKNRKVLETLFEAVSDIDKDN